LNRVVVDASVALAWIFQDETSDYAERVLQAFGNGTILVPAHWTLEVTNALLSAERKGQISVDDSVKCLELIEKLPISVDGRTADKAISNTLAIARAHGLTSYDAAYLELSLREAVALATLDSALAQACKRAGGTLA
jgi:predicted nucleic acid-binding protein